MESFVEQVARSRGGVAFTAEERQIARDAVVEVIESLGGVPTLANGNVSEGYFVNAMKAKLGNGATRRFASYAYLARKALKDLRGECTTQLGKVG